MNANRSAGQRRADATIKDTLMQLQMRAVLAHVL